MVSSDTQFLHLYIHFLIFGWILFYILFKGLPELKFVNIFSNILSNLF